MIKIDSKEIQKLYIAYFGRPGDPSGISYWCSLSDKLFTLREISDQFSRQEEYIKYISNDKSLEAQINKLYVNLFDRKSNFDGLNFWIDIVEKQNFKISDILYNLLYSNNKPFYLNPSQEAKDNLILENKISAAEIFTKQISRSSTLINLYQPDSLSPWISGNSLIKASNFIRDVKYDAISIDEVNELISSLSDNSNKNTNQTAIEIKDLSLSIPIYCPDNRSLTKRFAKKFINITGGKLTQSKNLTNILVLNNINLTIMKGERVGLIGHNGSGKTSFLRLISGIYQPTRGKINTLVDVYPMLQKTFLTSSELTGIDACKAHYLLRNYTLVGFESFLNEITDFSGLGSYISLPIKTYSEGMSARLIFSILTSSPHDCLAIDEGFGTGDADFCDRAEVRMEKFMESAATLFLASHSEELLKQFCDRGIVFSHGSIVFDGSLDDALNYYHTDDYYLKNVIK